MKFKELQKKTGDELRKELDNTTIELLRFRAHVATGGAGKDAGKIRGLRRKIARIKTLNAQPKKEVR
jgi:ribosomal protein L29